jgi:uncharacterized membrane protein YsdA (DUF1294 family)
VAWTYAGVAVVLSVVSFLAYRLDKRRAGTNGRRVPERTLHLLAVCGGWPGALLGQRQFRHKTRKASFQIIFWALVLLNLAVVGLMVYVLW